jgi:predicted dehydrogenase/sugar phosphate isomerase/epimerase
MKSAIVGCGVIAIMHAKVMKEMEDCQLIAVADSNIEKASRFAKDYGVKGCNAYSSLEELCQKEMIDVLHICTPHYLHVPMAVYGLEHGLSVFMEKPPAISREQFHLLEKAQEGRRLGICFQNRFNESFKAVKDMLKDPKTGKIKGARAFVTWNRPKDYYTESGWRGTWATEGGGALINQSIHTLDLLVQLIGKPIWTESSMHNHHLKSIIEVEDTVEAYMEFKNGPVCFYATTAHCGNSPVFIDVECENVTIRLEACEVTRFYPDGRKENVDYHNGYAMGKDYWGYGHTACIKEFYQCIKLGKKFPVRLEDVKDTFSLMMDVYQSAKEHKVIMFEKDGKLSGFADEIDADFEKQMEVLHECNIGYMELRSAYGKNISEYSLEEAQKLKEILDREKIKVSSIGSPIGKINITDDFEEHFELFCHVVALAKLFETNYIRIFSFYIPEGRIVQSYKVEVLRRMKRMISYAKEQGVTLLHENEKGIYGDIGVRCKELMEELYCDHFKQVFDFANFVQCGENVMEAFQSLKPYIAYIHIKDALKDSHMVVPAGHGDGNVADIIRVLELENYDGFYSLEPHLTDFTGLQQLERENDKTAIGNRAATGRDAFLTAHQAFRKLKEELI